MADEGEIEAVETSPAEETELSPEEAAMRAADAAVREEARALLAAGLTTEVFPRADTSLDFQALVTRLHEEGTDLRARLVIGGFTLEPVLHEGIAQDCESCMYYLVHRRFCELPGLMVPVEPEWSCRLWRI